MRRAVCIRSRLLSAAGMAVVFATPTGFAKDLGVRGESWPIAEPDLLEAIEARLAGMERSGELARLERQGAARARSRLEAPDRVPGIAPARQRRSWTFDPSITVAHDIRGPDGTLIAAAGTRIDPLEHAALSGDLLFIDATRDAEVAWALNRVAPSKIILLAGRPLDLSRRYGRAFFFDQGGRLARRLGLRFTPSVVRRAGAGLRITEIALDDTAKEAP